MVTTRWTAFTQGHRRALSSRREHAGVRLRL